MHLQIKSVVVAGSGGTGARNADEGAEGITIARPGRLLRLLDILAEDRRGGADGRDGFSLVRAAGAAIETGGEFSFSVETTEDERLRGPPGRARQDPARVPAEPDRRDEGEGSRAPQGIAPGIPRRSSPTRTC